MNVYQQFPMPHEGGGYSQTAAAGASNRVRLAKEELICPLCMSFYKNPRSLQCLHSYCEECLVGLHSSSKCSDTVQCPECRARTLLPGDGIQGKFYKLDGFHSLQLCIVVYEWAYVSIPWKRTYIHRHSCWPFVLGNVFQSYRAYGNLRTHSYIQYQCMCF